MPISVQYDAFQLDTFETLNEIDLAIVEGADVVVINVTSTTLASFAVTEGADIAAFTTTSTTKVNFDIAEGADVAAFNVTSRTILTFSVAEGHDVASFHALTGALLHFAISEGADVFAGRVWQGDFTLGDADYIVVPLENRVALVPGDISVIQVANDGQYTNVPDEWQRIDIDQTRGRRAG